MSDERFRCDKVFGSSVQIGPDCLMCSAVQNLITSQCIGLPPVQARGPELPGALVERVDVGVDRVVRSGHVLVEVCREGGWPTRGAGVLEDADPITPPGSGRCG